MAELGRGLRGGLALAASAVGVLVLAPAASAVTSCTFDNGNNSVNVVMSADNDRAVLTVTGAAIQVRGDGPVLSCPGAGGPPTVTNTDFVVVTDTSSNGDTQVSIHDPAAFAPGLTTTGEPGAAEIEFVLAPGGGTNDSLALFGTAGPDNWLLGSTGLNWNAAADTDSDTFLASPSDFDDIAFLPGAGDDVVSAQGGAGVGGPFSAATFVDISGESGADTLSGGNGPGGDLLRAADGADTLAGFGGTDLIVPGVGDDTVDGGAGSDTVDYRLAPAPLTLDLRVAGPQAADGSDTLTGIENVNGSAFADTLTGDAAANRLSGDAGDDTLDGREGADLLDGSSGSDTVIYAGAPAAVTANLTTGLATGGFDADTLNEIDHLIGSPFADSLTGNEDANLITGLAGVDTISALAGVDAVDVRDGGPDTASCGSEVDSATADQLGVDSLNADCEAVAFLPGGGGGGGGGGGDPADKTLTVRWRIARTQRALKQRALILKARCPSEPCTVVAGASGRLAGLGRRAQAAALTRLKLRRVTRQLRPGVVRTIKLGLTKRQRRAIKRRLAAGRRPVLKVTVRATDAAGNRVTRTWRVKLKA